MPIDSEITQERSDALAWRELMRATDADVNDSIMRAWENWRERETCNGRPNRVTGVDR